jgi:hypothetical protein
LLSQRSQCVGKRNLLTLTSPTCMGRVRHWNFEDPSALEPSCKRSFLQTILEWLGKSDFYNNFRWLGPNSVQLFIIRQRQSDSSIVMDKMTGKLCMCRFNTQTVLLFPLRVLRWPWFVLESLSHLTRRLWLLVIVTLSRLFGASQTLTVAPPYLDTSFTWRSRMTLITRWFKTEAKIQRYFPTNQHWTT